MPMGRNLRRLFKNLLDTRELEDDLNRELRAHLEMLLEQNMQAGMNKKDAERAARIELGGVEQVKEQVREQRAGNALQSVLTDCRFALRQLRKSPVFALVAVITLALGIGTTTAIFSVIYGVMIRPLAVPEAQQVVRPVVKYHDQLNQDAFTYREFRFLQEHSRAWAQTYAAFTRTGLNLASGNSAERVSAMLVSSDYFELLGLNALMGRTFSEDEDRDPGARVAILSHNLWQQRFGGDRAILGKMIHLNGEPYTVVGVMPASSSELQLDTVPSAFSNLQNLDLWTTLAPVEDSVGSGANIAVLARIRPNVTLEQAKAQIEALNAAFFQNYQGEARKQTLALSSVQEIMAEDLGLYLWILLAAVGFVLLIACVNVSNLLLEKGSARAKEIAVRAAMGASRGRLVRQFLSESLVLSALGCALGLVVAHLTLSALLRYAPIELPRAGEIRVDGWAFLFALAIAIFASVLSSIAPAFHAAKSDVYPALKESSGQSSSGRRSGAFRRGLVAAEIALSVILLIGASLLAQTFLNLLRVNPGFEPEGLLSGEIWLTGSRYHSREALNTYYESLIARVKEVPGVQETAVVSMGQPLERGGNISMKVNGEDKGSMDIRVVTPEYFQVLRATIRQGRTFTAADSPSSQPVAVVNEAFVRKFLHDGDPLLASVETEENPGVPRAIVGVEKDVKSYMNFPEPPTVFLPASQADYALTLLFDVWFPTHVMVRTKGDPQRLAAAVGKAIREADSSIPAGKVLPMEQVLARSLAIQKFMMIVVAVFAGLALLLASIGIYGVISFAVSQRTQEFGIRMALGANSSNVLGLVLSEAARLTLIGAGVGILGAIALRQAMESVLFGVRPTDPRSILVSAACLLTVVLLACYIPARRAARVDPMVALRYE